MIGCYCERDTIRDRSRWVTDLHDELHVSQLCIPGTHDSGAMHGSALGAACQSVPIDVQLKLGIRALDIRCHHYKDSFHIYHGIVDQKLTFDDVLNMVTAFFGHGSREVVYMLIKEEGSAKDCTRSFESTFRDKYWNRRPGLFWDPATADPANHQNPKLGLTRGRIVVIQNFDSPQTFGIRFKSGMVALQDNYDIGLGRIDLKCAAIRKHLDLSNANKQSGKIYINFFSAVASNPAIIFFKPRAVAEEVNNTLIKDIGKGRRYGTHTGICFFDFPSQSLIELIINMNK